jgi:hypothetical protein
MQPSNEPKRRFSDQGRVSPKRSFNTSMPGTEYRGTLFLCRYSSISKEGISSRGCRLLVPRSGIFKSKRRELCGDLSLFAVTMNCFYAGPVVLSESCRRIHVMDHISHSYTADGRDRRCMYEWSFLGTQELQYLNVEFSAVCSVVPRVFSDSSFGKECQGCQLGGTGARPKCAVWVTLGVRARRDGSTRANDDARFWGLCPFEEQGHVPPLISMLVFLTTISFLSWSIDSL